jgi:hypothetical protein
MRLRQPACRGPVSTAYVAHRTARPDVSCVGNAFHQLDNRFFGGFAACLPETMVDVLAPQFAVEGV